MSAAEFCPHCGANLQGEPVPEKYRVHAEDCAEQVARSGRCFCLPYGDATHFGRKVGIEVQGVYDGVLYYTCPDCSHAWPRFGGLNRMGLLSERYANEHNSRAVLR